jgi:hypothetical protein
LTFEFVQQYWEIQQQNFAVDVFCSSSYFEPSATLSVQDEAHLNKKEISLMILFFGQVIIIVLC